jgi:serine phosphatase RsbU (regulator of sigma subunit)
MYINYISMLENDEGLRLAYENLELSKNANNCKLISKSLGIIANVNYWNIGNTAKAFEYYELATKEAEKCNDKEALLSAYKNSENPYFNTKQYYMFKQIILKEEKIEPKLKEDIWHIASFGDLYRNLRQLDSADLFYKTAILLAEKQNDSISIMQLYFNYALIPQDRSDYKTAVEYCKKGILIAEKLKSSDIYNGYRQLSNMYRSAGDWLNAKKYLTFVVKEAEEHKRELSLIAHYRRMSEIEFKLKNYKIAYEYLLQNIELFSKHNSAKKTSELIKTEEGNIEKQKQLEIDLANEQKENERKVKNISFIALSGALLLICGIVFALLKIKKSNKIITAQKQEVEIQKHIVDEKQKEILDSITYARRLQQAILPSREFITQNAPDNFILYKPKDIVAGDFYWSEKTGSSFLIAAADCTGHGVPGAMVSVVCSNAINRTVNEFGITDTGKILDKTRELVIETFEKSSDEVKDGMDISLLCIDRQNQKVFWSGANNPLWHVQDNKLLEIKADKQPVGKSYDTKPFTTNEIAYKPGSIFYLFTDGFADQFGGPKGKKFKYKQFQEMLTSIHDKPMQEQSDIINQKFEDWKGTLEQVDDICIIAIKI